MGHVFKKKKGSRDKLAEFKDYLSSFLPISP